MKKALVFLISAALAMTVTAMPVSAADDDRNIRISTEIAPAYIVTIPTNTRVYYNVLDTDFGKVELTRAQLEPGKCVKVSLLTDSLLENNEDAEKVLPFGIRKGTAENGGGQAFTSERYTSAGEFTDLTIHIEQDDWNRAYAGEYADTVTFQIQYTDG